LTVIFTGNQKEESSASYREEIVNFKDHNARIKEHREQLQAKYKSVNDKRLPKPYSQRDCEDCNIDTHQDQHRRHDFKSQQNQTNQQQSRELSKGR
jgi:hypothetical protein